MYLKYFNTTLFWSEIYEISFFTILEWPKINYNFSDDFFLILLNRFLISFSCYLVLFVDIFD